MTEVRRKRSATSKSIVKSDPRYAKWVRGLSERYQRSQIKAAVSVNREMLLFY